jgi:uncharacterized protein YegJ (DUF2314 family)
VYGEGESMRLVSLGLGKLGLPDLVVEEVPRSLVDDMGLLVNAVAQLLAEGRAPDSEGAMQVELARVKNSRMQKDLQAHTQPGASRKATLRAVVARREEGDPENSLLGLSFPGTGTPHALQLAALDSLFGQQPDNVTIVPKEDPELAQVALKTRARLTELRPLVEKGLQPPQRLLIKAAFKTDDDNIENMWLEVTSWPKEKLRGTLANEPQHVTGLRMGASVEATLQEVSDYLYTRPDGTTEGGESSRILLRRQGR